MKIIRITFFSLLALSLIACAGIFIFFQTFDTDQYLPQITKKASIALGRPVLIGHLGLGLSLRGITLDAWPLTVADDLDFTTQPFIEVDRARISLDLSSLLLRREIHITDILLQSPQIHFIRSQEGRVNAQSIGRASQSAGDTAAVESPNISVIAKSEATKPRQGGASLPSVVRKDTIKVEIQDASISFIDQNQTMPLDIWLNGINVHGSALVSWDPSKRSARISDLSLYMDLSRLDIDQLKGISPETDSPVFKNITGLVQLNMSHLEIGASGDIEAKGDISITDAVFKNFNVIKALLSHTLGSFGGIEGNIDNLLNVQLQGKLGGDDTVIEKALARFSFHDKTFFIDDSLVQTNIFELTAKGSVDQGLNMDMQTMLHLNNDISAVLVDELGGLKFLMDDTKRIAIGASLKGVIPHLKYKPDKDFRKKSKRALMQEGGNILGILLGGGQSSDQGQGASSQDSGKGSKKNFKNIFKSLLQ